MTYSTTHGKTRWRLLLFLLVFTGLSCNNSYEYLERSPDWIGDNIYSTLQKDGRFDTYLELLARMDSSYIEVLRRTGSRTLFVPTDSAFAAFFADNPYGFAGPADMSTKLIKNYLSFYTLENAYVTSVLGSSQGPETGNCLRRTTTMVPDDTIPFRTDLPDNPQFARFKESGMYLKTPGNWTMVHFTQPYFDKKNMNNEDFDRLYPGTQRQNGDIHIFGAKIIEGNIVNLNGYIHVLDKVIMPPLSMWEYMTANENLSEFCRLLERFCEPVYDPAATEKLHEMQPESTDSVFYISFFDTADRNIVDDKGNEYTVESLLFSPAANETQNQAIVGQPPSDMPAIFAPDNQAMQHYIENSFLSEYPLWDSVPDDLAAKFVRTHMKRSFLNALPTRINDIVDDVKGDHMGYTLENVTDAQICRNGLVYTLNDVVDPRDFKTVVAPLLKNPDTRIFNWIINESSNNTALKFNYYLTSLENNFTLFIPLDSSFSAYPDPVNQTSATLEKKKMRFFFDEDKKHVNYISLNNAGDSIAAPTYNAEVVRNRLKDIVDHHIVVGERSPGQKYLQTKGGAYIKVDESAQGLRFQGAGDLEKGSYAHVIAKYDYNNGIHNGTVFLIDKTLEHTLKSFYSLAQSNITADSNISEFFKLLQDFDDPDATFFADREPATDKTLFYRNVSAAKQTEYVRPIFYKSDGIDYFVPFLGLYNYTVFVPVNEALNRACTEDRLFMNKDQIASLGNDSAMIAEIKRTITFIKNHFVDGAYFTEQYYMDEWAEDDGLPRTTTTSAKNQKNRQFYNLYITQNGSHLSVKKNAAGSIMGTTLSGSENIMCRQYSFAGGNIATNSRIVVHAIDGVLSPNNE